MRRRLGLLSGLLLALALTMPASAVPLDQWHRLNPFGGPGGNELEHERLTCVGGSRVWQCYYDKVPHTGYRWDATVGTFRGAAAARWEAPEWFPATIDDERVAAVYAGNAVYYPDAGAPFTVRQEYVVADMGGQEVLYQHWVGRFACPWYQTFDEALAANPVGEPDCAEAP